MKVKTVQESYQLKKMKRQRHSQKSSLRPIDLRKLRYIMRAFAQILEEDTSLYEVLEEEVQSCPSAFFHEEYAYSLPELKRIVGELEDELSDRLAE